MSRRPTWCPLAAALLCAALNPAAGTAQSRGDEIDRLRAEADRLASQQVRRAHEAVPLYRQAIALANASRDDGRAAEALAGLGEALRATNQPSAAAAALERAIATARRAGQPAIEAEALRILGALAVEVGQHDRAEAWLSRAVAIARDGSLADGRLLGTHIGALNALSVSARHQGRLMDATRHAEAARRLLEQAVAERREVPQRLLFQVPFNIGKSLADGGDYSSALTYFDSAFRAAQAAGNKGGQWHALFDTAEWYLAQGDIERATRYHERALALSRTMDSRDMEAHSLRGSGAVAEVQGQIAAATQFYTAAVSLMDRLDLLWATPDTLVARARVRFASGDRVGAERDVRDALGRAIRANETIGLARAHLELARQQLESGLFKEAEAEYTKGLNIARAQGVRPLVPIAFTGLGHAAWRRGDLLAAVRWYRSSVEAVATIRGRIPSVDLRTAFADATHATFSSLIAVLLELDRSHPAAGYGREALLAVEQERSQNLIQALDDQSIATSSDDRPARERDREEKLRSTVAQLQTALLSSEKPSNRNYLVGRLDDAERALAALEGSDQRSHAGNPVDHAWRRSPTDLAAMQQTLRDDETVLEFAQAGDRRVAFVVTRDRMEVVPLPDLDGLRDRVESFNRFLKAGAAAEAVAAGRAIARAFVDPILDRLRPDTRVLLLGVAGPPAAIPFAALPVMSAAGRPQPLISRYELAYVPSLTALAHLRSRPPARAPRGLLALADPGAVERDDSRTIAAFRTLRIGTLPYSGTEVRAVARYATNADVLVGNAASESAFKTRQDGYQILHFATHALVDSEMPSRSALLLAGSDENDGLLQPGEIYRQGSRAELVVLSACQSAGGRSSTSEGALSLARAFIYAGARSVVASHWDVNDRSSAKLVERFYGRLGDGRQVAAALREAQLEFAGPNPYATAAHWAGFMVSGDPQADPQLHRPPTPTLQLAVTVEAVLLALSTLFGWSLIRMRMRGGTPRSILKPVSGS